MSEAADRTHEDAAERGRRQLLREGVIVLYEDNHLLCIAKPAGLLSQGRMDAERCVPEIVDAYRRVAEAKPGRAFVGLVHRLDRNVSGAMVVAKTSKAARRLTEAFRTRAAGLAKTYLAWVGGRPTPDHATLTDRLRRDGKVTKRASVDDPEAKDATLTYTVEARGRRASRVRVDLETGVTHQIRAQLALAGHPLIGDRKYGGTPKHDRPALHAWQLTFPHPVRDEIVTVTAPLPADLRRLDASLGMDPPAAPPPHPS